MPNMRENPWVQNSAVRELLEPDDKRQVIKLMLFVLFPLDIIQQQGLVPKQDLNPGFCFLILDQNCFQFSEVTALNTQTEWLMSINAIFKLV